MKITSAVAIIAFSCASVGPVRAGESLSDTTSGSGQELSWNELFDYADGGSTKIETQHSTDVANNSIETQKVTYTDGKGNAYTETDTSTYDASTGKTTTNHSSEGTPPTSIDDAPAIDNGGVDVSGKSESQTIDTRYRDGGVTDTFTDPKTGRVSTEHSVDMDTGKTTNVDPVNKVERQWQGPPARTLPTICRVSSLFTKTSSNDQKAQDLMSRMMANQGNQDVQSVMKEWLKENKADFAAGPRSMRMEKMNWAVPTKMAGYSTEHYRVIVENRPVADLWIAPKVNIWNVLQGDKPARASRVRQMLLPHWKKVSEAEQRRVFKHLVVTFKTSDGKGYLIKSVIRASDTKYAPPATPSDYKKETINVKEVQEQLNTMMQ